MMPGYEAACVVQSLTHALSASSSPAPRLLLVQHNPLARRSLARFLRVRFAVVLVADCPEAAELHLGDPVLTPTHLVSGQRFGTGKPCGTDLIPRWRRLCPSLQRVALVTADDDLPGAVAGVDAIFKKPIDPNVIVSFLLPDDLGGSMWTTGTCSSSRPGNRTEGV
jgi:hypothetical protein